MDVNILASWTVVLGFVGGVFSWVILRPLNKAIDKLDRAIGELRMDLLTAEDRRAELEKKVVIIELKADKAHERIDRMEGRK